MEEKYISKCPENIFSQTPGSTHVCWNQSFVLDSNKHFASYFAAFSMLFYIFILVKNVDYFFDDNGLINNQLYHQTKGWTTCSDSIRIMCNKFEVSMLIYDKDIEETELLVLLLIFGLWVDQ